MALVDTAQAPASIARTASARMDWGHALRSLQRLLNDKEDTTAVFEIMFLPRRLSCARFV